ncbi:hypothetical protein J7Y46_003049 [Vibrio parahaemolyticus]|nr:hypothetical protein [Vibrio parahaemolyticus]EHV5554794.1 hypothetical protein [Vibrio parahaemolyticus]
MPNEIYAELSKLCTTQLSREEQWLNGLRGAVFYLRDELEKELGVESETYIDLLRDRKETRYVNVVDINNQPVNALLEGTIDGNGVSTVVICIALALEGASQPTTTWMFRINVRYSERGAQYAMVNKDGSTPDWHAGRTEFIGVLIQELIKELKFDPLNRYD